MSLHELLLLAGLLQVEVDGVGVVGLARVGLDAAQGGFRAFIAVTCITTSFCLLNLRLETN